jgi:hypothetical protein
MRTFAILLEYSTASALSCFFPLVKEGILRVAPKIPSSLAKSKPKLAKIASPEI